MTIEYKPLEVFKASKDAFARQFSKHGPSFAERVSDTFEQPLHRLHDKRNGIQGSGRFTAQGVRVELATLYRAILADFEGARQRIAENLGALKRQRQADARTITTESNDPTRQLIRELRIGRLDAHLRSVDKMELGLRMRLALEDVDAPATALLADVLVEAERLGAPLVDREVALRFLSDLTERADPGISELAELARAYDDMAQQAMNEVRRLANLDAIDLSALAVAASA